MIKCEECSKKLGIIQGYRHPALGKRCLVCGNCFDKVNNSMEKWRVFCRSDLFNAESSKIDIQEAWNKWQHKQTMLINEKKLNLMQAEDRKYIEEMMIAFLFEHKEIDIEGYTPEK